MDPNMIHVDWERTLDALSLIVLLAFIVERALAVVFENRIFIERFDRDGIKETIAVAVSIAACFTWKLDAIGMILLTESTTVPGYVLTGLVIAGGSKASLKLFHDVLDIRTSTHRARHDIIATKASEDAARAAATAEAATTKGAAAEALRKIEVYLKRAKKAADKAGSKVAKDAIAEAEKAKTAAEAALKNLEGE